MKVVILGSGTGVPEKSRGSAGIYVNVAGEHIVLDAGPGTARALSRIGVTYLDIDRIFLTHFHPDHCLDIVSLLFAMRIPRPARTKPLAIYGPKGLCLLHKRFEQAFPGWINPKTYKLSLHEIGKASVRFKGYSVLTRQMEHSTRAIGYRLQQARQCIAYSGDTDFCRGAVELGKNADLFILECALPDKMKTKGHLTPSECAMIASQAGCKHLVLTHFYPLFKGYDIGSAVGRLFKGRISLAKDGLSFVL